MSHPATTTSAVVSQAAGPPVLPIVVITREEPMPQPLAIIGTPSSAGAYAPGQELAPTALRSAGLLSRFSAAGREVVDYGDSPVFRWRPDRAKPYAQNPAAVRAAIIATAERVQAAAVTTTFPAPPL